MPWTTACKKLTLTFHRSVYTDGAYSTVGRVVGTYRSNFTGYVYAFTNIGFYTQLPLQGTSSFLHTLALRDIRSSLYWRREDRVFRAAGRVGINLRWVVAFFWSIFWFRRWRKVAFGDSVSAPDWSLPFIFSSSWLLVFQNSFLYTRS
jgi:hypothetical protein